MWNFYELNGVPPLFAFGKSVRQSAVPYRIERNLDKSKPSFVRLDLFYDFQSVFNCSACASFSSSWYATLPTSVFGSSFLNMISLGTE